MLKKSAITAFILLLVLTLIPEISWAGEQMVNEKMVLTQGAEDTNYVLAGETACLAIDGGESGIEFKNCTFECTDEKLITSSPFSAGIGLLCIKGTVTFTQCSFNVGNVSHLNPGNGNDAVVNITDKVSFKDCSLNLTGSSAQKIGGYSADITFDDTDINGTGCGGWVIATYGNSNLNVINGSNINIGGTVKTGSGNTNVLYMETDSSKLTVKDSKIRFDNNQSGGFVLNNGSALVENSLISACKNLGNGSNSGTWTIKNSTIDMSQNSGHGLSCARIDAENSKITAYNNSLLGIFAAGGINSKDCEFNLSCNGSNPLYANYLGNDIQIKADTPAVFKGAFKQWLGSVNIFTKKTGNLNLEIEKDCIVVKQEQGISEGIRQMPSHYVYSEDKIADLSETELCHHKYNWDYNGTVSTEIPVENYGALTQPTLVKKAVEKDNGIIVYPCTGIYKEDSCEEYITGPSVALFFDKNTKDEVTSMPEEQQLAYSSAGEKPEIKPINTSNGNYYFVGWYEEPECKNLYDFSTVLEANKTIYAKWNYNIPYYPPYTPPENQPENPPAIPPEETPEVPETHEVPKQIEIITVEEPQNDSIDITEVPKTDDKAYAEFWMLLALITAAGAGAIATFIRKK